MLFLRISSDVSGTGRASRAGAFLAPVLALALSAGPVSAIAQEPPPEPPPITQPTPLSQVGETVLNPANGQEVVIAQVIADNSGQNAYVLTESLEMILTRFEVDDLIHCITPDPDDGSCTVHKVISVVQDPVTGIVHTVNVQLQVADTEPEPPIVSQTLSQSYGDELAAEQAANAPTEGADPIVPPQSTSGTINEVWKGAGGGNGGNAYGVEICIIKCFTIGKSGSDGDDGITPPPIIRTVPTTHGLISVNQNGVDGIKLGSIGGDGGDGGDSFGNIGPYDGGDGGAGGIVTLNNFTDISTSGGDSHGIAVFSQSGTGGDGGDTFIGSGGGSGGSARTGGTVTVNNSGDITTVGNVSHGIYALSIGGAAGDGGDNWGFVGDAGSGASGGNGGSVFISNHGEVHTTGVNAHAIFGQSIGGTGGNGGDAVGLVALGGGASSGGRGGAVTIENHADARVFTDGDHSMGIFGQSVGGSGGDSGNAVGLGSLGSSGGSGSTGGTVRITNSGQVVTLGTGSHAVFAQSVGGGGGNAATTVGFGTLGGSGGSGGNGGFVRIDNRAGSRIVTQGVGAHAVLAQSIGGGGGNAGTSVGAVTLGGSGSVGGNGGTVAVDSAAAIDTTGHFSYGILAQSIGGGGGSSGTAAAAVTIGGKGAAGGSGGDVSVGNTGSINTGGNAAHGIFAQSVGGGGGSSGSAGGLVSIGGSGSSGGDGHGVSVTNDGAITTQGSDARGVFAQSVGGGGGAGGDTGGLFALGGSGGAGSDGGSVIVANHAGGDITTGAFGGDAIFAQSVGGGGGSGASSGGLVSLGGTGSGGGNGGNVTVTNHGRLATGGTLARGIFAQSVGGGGGSGGYSGGLLTFGGSGSGVSIGGTVRVTNFGRILTAGSDSSAIQAQSIGGGGGDGGSGGGVFLTIGGSAGGGGNAGAVIVGSSGDLSTAGADSHGIFAQSVGGGGGNGGNAIGGALFAGVAIGGSGGQGGDGAAVNVTTTARDEIIGGNTVTVRPTITTSGDRSAGIFAQSIGGGGGNGGYAVQATVGTFLSAAVGIGGSGDQGGIGGRVDVDSTASILTGGADADGILAQSIGGGGGNGGFAIAGAVQFNPIAGGSVGVGVGGSGDGGGDGGTVELDFTGTIDTGGDRSRGVVAQSIGGGGGNGGFSIAGGVSASGALDASISVGVGGSGGVGGAGGLVDASVVDSTIRTDGEDATAVQYQSVGGGGGNGGFNISGAISVAAGGGAAIGVGIGGSGAAGGTGGKVDGDFNGVIETLGARSAGVLMQSVGGGGGNGGFNISGTLAVAGLGSGAISVGVGGSGSVGSAGGEVVGDVSGVIETAGAHAAGVIMQSVGGGGGNGGYDITAALGGAGIGSGSVGVGLGGSGAGGGAGGAVTATVNADITTGIPDVNGVSAGDADGILIQSVGGGGGNGGFDITAPLNFAGIGNGAVGVSLGGSGSGGGAGGEVRATLNGAIHTLGDRSDGVIVQSIGGGGGNGGFAINIAGAGAGIGSGSVAVGLGGAAGAGSNGGLVTASFGGSIATEGDDAVGSLFQSVGGGGGNGGFAITGALNGAGIGNGAVSVGLGGAGGGGGDGAAVDGTVNASLISTLGDRAGGIVMQSVGGGGGNGGFDVNTAIAGSGIGSGSVSVGLGGGGGTAGNGSAVTASMVADVSTAGADSDGVLVQSVGGGGGNGGFDVTVPLNGAGVGNGAIGVSIGGAGGGGGASGIVSSSFSGDVHTQGARSDGVIVQSIGGGGGNGGFSINGTVAGSGVGSGSVAVGVGGFAGDASDGNRVTASVDGSVATEGEDAVGILFQSVGGGGGNGGFTVAAAFNGAGVGNGAVTVGVGGTGGGGGAGAAVDGTVSAAVSTAGDRSGGIIMQSLGGGGGNGGFNVALAGAGAGVGTGAVSVGVGGAAGDGGDGGALTARITESTVVTAGLDSTAVLLQSVGGGGGNGGFNVTVPGAGAGVGSGSVSVGVGGTGGGGGDGALVDAGIEASIHTTGERSGGVIVQSIGGGGGNGGFDVSATGSGAGTGNGAVGVGVGGSGDLGGVGGAVTASYTGTTLTEGNDSSGVLFQSVGGGGGNGGFNVAFAGSGAGVGSGAVSVGVGGSAGDGGASGAVDGSISGVIVTRGDRSAGAIIQSVGGGGGNGGFDVSVAGSGAGTGSGAVGVGVGGFGGDGGDGAAVTASMDADVATSGIDSDGVLIQSIGGGGGNGAFDVTVAGSGAGTGSGTGSISVGGFGSEGGDGKAVTAALAGDVLTTGQRSGGLIVQSIGGGGGNGGFSVSASISGAGTGSGALSVGVGGFGASGGSSGLVTAAYAGDTLTEGADATAVLFQSVGGGGGSGGFSVAGSISGAGTGSGTVSVGVGGAGGAGSDAGGVIASLLGNLATQGDRSNGVVAQSIGGGGGNGGFTVGGGISGAGTGGGGVSVGVGGFGGDGGNASFVTAAFEGDAVTSGDDTTAVLFQSIGGGGGNGGFSVAGAISGAGKGSGAVSVGVGGFAGGGGDAGAVTGTITGDVLSQGNNADAIVVQSIGGGGGNGGLSVAGAISGAGNGSGAVGVGVGGFGGDGGDAGAVSNTVTGNVLTEGSGSGAIAVQSLGGGGGNGGLNVSGAISLARSGSGGVAVGIGGFGGDGGSASTVASTVTGDVMTAGDDARGILAQSLGGGGGNGGLDVAGAISATNKGSGAAAVGIGGFGGRGGSAGAVTSGVTGDVVTHGAGSGAIVVQSLGGGGGNGGLNVSGAISAAGKGSAGVGVGVGGFGGGGGAAAAVTSTVVGDVLTEGDDAGGILAQSLGGGGGNGSLNVSGAISASRSSGSGSVAVGVGGFGGAGGSAGAVTSDATGNIFTFGDGSNGFTAQSLGGGGGNGGLNVSGTINLAKSSGGAIGIGVGGFGGLGGDAAAVTSTLTGQVETGGAGSTGILLQSLGGGGGNGGLNVSGALNIGLNGTGAGVALGVGGFGGGGGVAADVALAYTGNVLTSGASSGAVTAQSLGGGGGNGAINVSGAIAGSNNGNAFALGVGVGGFGGGGGSAGNVDVAIDGSIVASGIASDEIVTTPAVFDGEEELVAAVTRRVRSGGSHGVLAQSIGGGGGNGGLNVSGGIALAKPGTGKSYGLTVGVGGFGGGAGDAGTVAVDVDSHGGIVAANGDAASGIAAQSIGGGGGNGGLNVAGGITMDGTIAVGVGGFGGDGGKGGDVSVASATDIVTAGSKASGILAQSIGGGGGNGGINVSGGITPQTKSQGKAVSVVFGVGGFGGAADTSGNVTVTHRGDIETAGELSHGILAQSIAGGGGNGSLNVSANASGNSRFAFAGGVGGHGGAGADAGTVTVVSDGNITTRGGGLDDGTVLDFQTSSGNGILAQSIGGGGGQGGMNVTGVFALKGSPVSFGLGGFGAGGGDASSVSVTHGGSSDTHLLISTSGDDSAGIVAQSIGGGGGNAGANFMGSVTLGAGGAGGGTGTGLPDANRCDGWDPRLVTENCVNWDKVIAELDKRKASKGGKSTVAVQVAIGGRGGEAGNASTATVNHFGNIVTAGDRSEGIVAQSIGGGGGNAAVNIGMAYAGGGIGVNLAVGGAPGDGGIGDDVSVRHEGDITTSGVDSAGIFAQSIGGGGGNVATNLVRGTTTGGTISVTLGRIGGTGGSAGNVSVSSDGTITTLGNRSVGLLAQSVGNGGGKSGSSSIALGRQGKKPKKPNPVGLTLALGLEGGAGGSAGNVDVTARGLVQTDGLKSHAIFAQSVGGGGGISAMEMTPEVTSSNLVLTQGGTGGTGGTSGQVTVTNFAELQTFGEESKGIFAQSIGGGGGASEMSVDGGWESGAGGAVIALGGDGGAGAVSGAVTVANSGLVVTRGDESAGIHAQSIGGGGGNGELTFSGSVSAEKSGAMSLSLAIGGEGGSGAAAGGATVTNSGRVATAGAQSSGIVAQSIGGGGGNADLESELGVDSDSGSTQLGLSFGGTGGTGGTGGNVDVTNEEAGVITTGGDGAHGIFAQSIGGGGGNSDSKVSTSAISGTQNFGLGFAMGGTGGTGGTGGDVTVVNAGLIETLGDGAHGIYSISIGGGGGNGSMQLVSNIELTAIPTATGFNPLLGVGGVGGNGNDGGAVTVTNSGSIVTHGENSNAIVAMSIGGGGGNATLAIGAGLTTGDLGPISAPEADPLTDPVTEEVTISAPLLNRLGGTGGEGGQGGAVTVVHTGDIVLWGEGSQAIVAQSVNGGGGNIRFGLTGVTDLTGEAGLFFALGADDAQDSVASRVSVTSTGSVTMMGDNSIGHGLQSIGGGGGTLAFDLDLGKAHPVDTLPVEVALGGSDGVNNGGGDLVTAHTGDIGSIGRNSHGMFLQSIGGGGGRAFLQLTQAEPGGAKVLLGLGGDNGENETGGFIDLRRAGSVATEGDRAFGTAAQSIGGGGGSITVELALAENPDAAAEDSTASVAAAGPSAVSAPAGGLARAATLSASSADALAGTVKLSVSAGAPGAAAIAAPAAAASGAAKIPAPTDALAGAAAQAGIRLGASSGFGLDGGDLALSLDGDLLTQGRQSHGLFFQSIGAGGGLALVSGAGNLPAITLGGAGEATGSGGDLALRNTGDIRTEGWMAHGVFLQSIGGGGGAVFTDLGGGAPDVDLLSGGVGDGGAIAFTQTGDIQATGDDAFGIFVQSLGGGGGAVDISFAGTAGGLGRGGAIDLAIDGSVLALGANGTAIFAQSEGRDGGGDITISLSAGDAVVGGLGGAGIELRGGGDNSITNRGLLGTLDEVLGTAIVSGPSPVTGNDTIANFGTVTGSVLLDGGVNLFRNEADAVFSMGSLVDLSGDAAGDPVGSLVNFGTLLAGGFERRLETELDGNFVQDGAALVMADYDLSRRSESVQADRISITGSAELAGTIELALWNPGFVLPGHFDDVLVSAEGGLSAADVELAGVPESVVASFELGYPNATDAVLTTHIDFSPGGLNRNQTSVGDYVNGIQLAGGSLSFAPLAANLLFTEKLGELQQSYDSLNPVVHAESLSHTLLSSSRFGDQLMDCRRRDGDYRFLGQGECRWFRLARRFLDRDATAENFAYAQDGLELSGGFQAEIAPGRHLALGASFTRSDSVTGKLAHGESDLLQVGLTLKQRHEDLMLTGVISGGHGWFDTSRIIDVPGIAGIATSNPGIDFFSLRGRISHDTQFESWYLRSIMDAGVNYLRLDAFVEDGVPVVSAIVPEQNRTYLSLQPALEFGGEWRTTTDLLLRPYGRVGVLYLGGETSPQVSARFIGAPAAAAPFTVTAGMDRFYADVALGLDILYLDGNVFRIESNGQFGDETRAWGIEVNWSLDFE